MGENKVNVSLVHLECPKFLDKALTSPAKEAGRTLANIFYAVFGPVNYNVEKLRLRHAENLKKYHNDIQSELNKIPEEKLTEPKLSIVGPSLEASKFYTEEPELRKMFAKLIASSMNIDTNSKSHPAFVEIIKQLSCLDASNLNVISKAKALPIAQYKLVADDGSFAIIITNVFLSNPVSMDIRLQSSSISNLIRLGLVNANYQSHLANEPLYLQFNEDSNFKAITNSLEETLTEDPNYSYKKCEIQKGTLDLTPLGENFSLICI